MTTLQSRDNQTVQQTGSQIAASGDSTIEFRVSRPGAPRRRLKLVGSRYTIGSGPECSVRLDDPSVRQLHAVLRRENGRVLLRAYGSPILVNGRAVAEGELFVDDHFQIGPYVFELSVGPQAAQERGLDSRPDGRLVEPTTGRSADSKIDPSVGDPGATLTPQETRVVPRRRLSFASAMQMVPAEEPCVPAEEFVSAEDHRPNKSLQPEADFDSAVDEDAADAEKVSLDKTPNRPLNAELFDQHRAILANERRWQERSKRQLEKFRQKEQKSAAQIEALRTAQELAERRARGAEDAVETLKQQVTELAGRIAAVTSTVMPGLEQRIDQQYQESVVANRQYQSLVDGLRGRLDFLQSALTEVQAETEEIRQQTVATREDQQEFAASTDTLEQTLQRMAEEFQAGKADADEKAETLRQNLYQTSHKLADLTGQLEETRQNGHGLGAMVQQLRSSLQNAQTEAQRFATVEQIEETMRLLKANDQRISQLTEEYDSQSNQLQHECDALRLRLEQSEQIAADALAAATEALNEAVDQRRKIESLAENNSNKPETDSGELVRDQATVDVDAGSQDAVSLNAEIAENEITESNYIQEAGKDSLDTGEVSWYDAEGDSAPVPPAIREDDTAVQQPLSHSPADDEASSDDADTDYMEESWREPNLSQLNSMMDDELNRLEDEIREIASGDSKLSDIETRNIDTNLSLSQSQFHLPLEVAPPDDENQNWNENRGQDTVHESRIASSQTEHLQQYTADDDEADFAATYQYAPGQDLNFGSLNFADARDGDEEPAERDGEAHTNDAESLGLFGATAFLDEPISADVEEQHPEPHESREVEASQPQSYATETSGPRSAAEVLASLGISIEDSQEPADAEPAGNDSSHAPVTPVPTATPEPNAAAAQSAEVEEDEDSIEAYMNRLLRRVQGQSEAEEPVSRTQPQTQVFEPVAKKSEPSEPGSLDQMQASSTHVAPAKTEPAVDAPYVPRSQAPERNSNLAAMRELANSSARTAIAASARKKMSHEVLFKYGLFGMGLLAGGAVLVGTQFEFGPWMLIAVCCFGLSCFFLFEGFSLSRQLAETRPENGDSQPPETIA